MTNLNQYIEHTLLKADTSISAVRRICEEALKHQFGGVCLPPFFMRDARRLLGEPKRSMRLSTVVGFPMGYSAIAAKIEEIKRATEEGADDIDAVVNIAAVKSAQWNHVNNELESLLLATSMRGRTLKLILECGLLTETEIQRLCERVAALNIPFVKTGTGQHGIHAAPSMVATLRQLLPPAIQIKAAGGIRTRDQAEALIYAGAARIGTSAGIQIIG
jgi:deoxyribose-phosphate aldolase